MREGCGLLADSSQGDTRQRRAGFSLVDPPFESTPSSPFAGTRPQVSGTLVAHLHAGSRSGSQRLGRYAHFWPGHVVLGGRSAFSDSRWAVHPCDVQRVNRLRPGLALQQGTPKGLERDQMLESSVERANLTCSGYPV